MKKSITRPDGTTEVVEGTPEEISEYERKVRGGVQEAPKPKGPGLLTDVQDHFLERLEGVLEQVRLVEKEEKRPHFLGYPQHTPECEITVAQRGWWCVNPPRCTCGYFVYPGQTYTYRYTYTWPDSNLKVGDLAPNTYRITC